jgi:type I restriction enzyme S subunit
MRTVKDSGVEWLGPIPKTWSLARLQRYADFQSGGGFPEAYQGDLSQEFPFLKVDDLGKNASHEIKSWQNTVSKSTASHLGAKILPEGTLVMAKIGAALLLGRVRQLVVPSCVDNNMIGIAPRKKLSGGYFSYFLSILDFAYFVNPGTVPSTSGSAIGANQIPIPPKAEQDLISKYLDKETSQIDHLISKKEQLIEKLLERKQALITQVVTKGLDPNVPMKDSGVEWLGEVPSAWQVKPHWAFLKEKKVPVGNLHSELTLLSLTKQGVIVRDLEAGGKFPTSFEGYQKVAPDDLVLCLFDVEETPRTVGLAPSEGMITSAYTLMRATGINPHFLEWYLIGMDNEKRFKPFYSGLRNTLQKPIFASIRFAVPLSSEQAEIVQYLDKETSQIDSLVEKTRKAIELLKERRQALITQVVTGKIDVRGFAGGNS